MDLKKRTYWPTEVLTWQFFLFCFFTLTVSDLNATAGISNNLKTTFFCYLIMWKYADVRSVADAQPRVFRMSVSPQTSPRCARGRTVRPSSSRAPAARALLAAWAESPGRGSRSMAARSAGESGRAGLAVYRLFTGGAVWSVAAHQRGQLSNVTRLHTVSCLGRNKNVCFCFECA